MEYEITEATQSSVKDIVNIENTSFTCPWSEKTFNDAVSNDNIVVYTVSDRQAIYGFYCLMHVEDEAELLNIAVMPSHRGIGLGQQLMAHAVMYAQTHGINNIYLEVRESNITAQNLYKKFGFTSIGIRKRYYSQPIENAIVMLRKV